MQIWIQAFIPNSEIDALFIDEINDTITLPAPGQFFCFKTDERWFGYTHEASYRMQQLVELEFLTVDPWVEITRSENRTGQTIGISCGDPLDAILCDDYADTSDMEDVIVSRVGASVTAHFKAASSNPCFFPSPDIDWSISFTINTLTGYFALGGLIDEFPAIEAYFQIDDDDPVALLQCMPTPDTGPEEMMGSGVLHEINSLKNTPYTCN